MFTASEPCRHCGPAGNRVKVFPFEPVAWRVSDHAIQFPNNRCRHMIMHDYGSGLWPGGITFSVDQLLRDKLEKVILIPDKFGTTVIVKQARSPTS